MSTFTVPCVTGLPPYTDFLCLPLSPCKGGWTRHSWHNNSFSSHSLYNIRGLLGRWGVTSPVTEVTHTAQENECAIIYHMNSYEVHPTWSRNNVPLFSGTLAECQSFCYMNIITFRVITNDYPFRLKIGEQSETDQA